MHSAIIKNTYSKCNERRWKSIKTIEVSLYYQWIVDAIWPAATVKADVGKNVVLLAAAAGALQLGRRTTGTAVVVEIVAVVFIIFHRSPRFLSAFSKLSRHLYYRHSFSSSHTRRRTRTSLFHPTINLGSPWIEEKRVENKIGGKRNDVTSVISLQKLFSPRAPYMFLETFSHHCWCFYIIVLKRRGGKQFSGLREVDAVRRTTLLLFFSSLFFFFVKNFDRI